MSRRVCTALPTESRVSKDRELSEGLVGSARNKAEVERTLLEITARASANAEGEVGVGVGVGLSIVVAGEVRSIGATTVGAQRMDRGQAEDGDGPCLRALRSGESVAVSDYAGESRWPSTSARPPRRASAARCRAGAA